MTESSSRCHLQICASNRLAQQPELLEELADHGCLVEREKCLDQCTRCEAYAFALVSGQFLFAENAEELLRKLR